MIQENNGRIGLIAGSGSLPLIFAEEVRRRGYAVIAVAHTGQTLPALEEKVDKLFWIRMGQLDRLISLFQQEGIHRAVMAGGIKKARFFIDGRPDLRMLNVIARASTRNDDSILRAVAEELAREGIAIEAATRFVPSLFAPGGNLSSRPPTQEEWEDLQLGLKIARELGRADVGQCIVVKMKAILAVEAMEGTDETIRRGGRIAEGAVVVKASKPNQDLRFDLPTVGPETIRTMKEVGASCLAVEAGKTVILDRDATIAEADAAGISIVGLQGNETP